MSTDFQTTIADLVKEVRRLAEAAPGYQYQASDPNIGCLYEADERNPQGCIVGAAARHLDLSLDGQQAIASDAVATVLDVNLTDSLRDRTPLLGWLNRVQEHQDNGLLWGGAVAEADKVFK